MTAAIAVGVLVTAGVYLILQRGLIRVVAGFVLLGHAVNILLVAAGGMFLREAPLLGDGDRAGMADPLPQAFVLTAIVITFGITVYLFAIARAGGADDPGAGPEDPDTQDPDAQNLDAQNAAAQNAAAQNAAARPDERYGQR